MIQLPDAIQSGIWRILHKITSVTTNMTACEMKIAVGQTKIVMMQTNRVTEQMKISVDSLSSGCQFPFNKPSMK
jgi:hypothetical protein